MAGETRDMKEAGQAGALLADQVMERLARVIQWSDGFTLAPVRCNHPAQRGGLAQKLRERLPDRRLLEVTLDKPLVSLLDELAGRWDPASPPDAVSVYGLEQSIGAEREYSRVFGRLNHDRELLRQAVPMPLLLWLPDFALDYLARGAPDFWAWRSGVYEFPTDTSLWLGEAIIAFSAERAAIDALPLEEKHREIERLERLLDAARALPRQGRTEQEIMASSLHELGQLKHSLADYQEANRLYEESLRIYEQLSARGQADSKGNGPAPDHPKVATLLNNLGAVQHDIGDMATAKEYLQRAVAIQEEVCNRGGLAAALNNIGGVYYHMGQLQEALECFQRALALQEETGNSVGLAVALNNIGGVYRDIGRLPEALEYLQRGLALQEEVGSRAGLAATLNNIGVVRDVIGHTEGALEHYHRALTIEEEVGNRAGQAVTLDNIGKVYDATGHVERALEYYQRALAIREEIGDRAGLAATLSNIARAYYATGQAGQARDCVQRALLILSELLGEDHPSLVEARRNLESLPAE